MKNHISLLSALLLSATCAPAFATPASDAIAADKDLVSEVTSAREQEIEEQLKKTQEKMLKLPDNERRRAGSLSGRDILVEKASNMRMRLDKAKINEEGKPIDITEYKFIENGKIYGFYAGKLENCNSNTFDVIKSDENWIIFNNNCLNHNLSPKDPRRGYYNWMLYDRKYHKLVDLESAFNADYFHTTFKNHPQINNYKNGKYTLYYPHVNDTLFLNIQDIYGKKGCYWKNRNDPDDSSSICTINPHDLIEDGVPEKSK